MIKDRADYEYARDVVARAPADRPVRRGPVLAGAWRAGRARSWPSGSWPIGCPCGCSCRPTSTSGIRRRGASCDRVPKAVSASQRRPRLLHRGRDRQGRRLRPLRADDPLRPGPRHARSRRRAAWRGRLASRGSSSWTCRSRRSADRRSSATARFPRTAPLDDAGIPSTYVPARNTVFLSLAMAWAEVVGADAIVIGVNALDYSGYPDCRPEYLRAFERVAALATRAGVEGRPLRILAPLLELSKADIIRRGLALGVDYGLTLSCYDPVARRRAVRPLRQLPACARGDSRRRGAEAIADCGPARLSAFRSADRHSMTERLYYTIPIFASSTRPLVDTVSHDGQTALVLDRTAFYPDLRRPAVRRGHASGRARSWTSSTTRTAGVLHVVDRAPSATALHGAIDWTRRFDHMQQHTGQHVLSAAFDRAAERQDRELSPRRRTTRRSISRARCRPQEIARAETEANRVVWEDRPVTIRFADCGRSRDAGAAQGVEARGDAAADRRRGLRSLGVRRHARRAHRRDRDHRRVGDRAVPRRLADHLSLRRPRPDRLPRAARRGRRQRARAVGAARGTARGDRAAAGAKARICAGRSRTSRSKLAAQEADALAAAAQPSGERAGSCSAAMPGWDAAGLKTIASRIVERPGHVAVLVGDPPAVPIVVARSADVAHRRGRDPAQDRRASRRQGRRPPRDGAGRRPHRGTRGCARTRARTRLLLE